MSVLDLHFAQDQAWYEAVHPRKRVVSEEDLRVSYRVTVKGNGCCLHTVCAGCVRDLPKCACHTRGEE